MGSTSRRHDQGLKENARKAGLRNVRAVLAEEAPAELPAGANVYFLANTLHEIEDKIGYLRLVRRGMTSLSRLAVVDFLRKPTKRGPPLGERIPLTRIAGLLEDAGFVVERCFRPAPTNTLSSPESLRPAPWTSP
jgi:hypothetical protein